MDETARLKAELVELNAKCQLARDNEVRHALQRGRLEAERAKLLVSLMEAIVPAPTSVQKGAPLPYRIVVHEPTASPFDAAGINGAPAVVATFADIASVAAAGAERHKVKPDGLPTLTKMIAAAFEDAATHGRDGLTPREVTEFIRRKWWPDVPNPTVNSSVWRMGKAGKLGRIGARYTLTKPNGTTPRQLADLGVS